MIYIAHRGNIHGPNTQKENTPEYLLEAINLGYCVETDLWVVDENLYLGHDEPQYLIDATFIRTISHKLYCHCKNIEALCYVLKEFPEVECFFHDSDDCVLTSRNRVWTYPGKQLTNYSICVMPERVNQTKSDIDGCYGICSDFVSEYKNEPSPKG